MPRVLVMTSCISEISFAISALYVSNMSVSCACSILYGTLASSAAHKKHMAHLWNCVKDPTFQELFYQFLLSVDTSNMVKGQAPHTSFKQRIQAQQAPEAIKFLVAALDDVSIMAKPMADLSNDYDRRQRFRKSNASSSSTAQLQSSPTSPI